MFKVANVSCVQQTAEALRNASCMYACIYVCMYAFMQAMKVTEFIHVYVSMYVCMYAFMHAMEVTDHYGMDQSIHIYVHLHIYTPLTSTMYFDIPLACAYVNACVCMY